MENWTFDDALRAQEEWEREHGAPFDDQIDTLLKGIIPQRVSDRGPFFKWQAMQNLKEMAALYENGKKEAIIEALFVCCEDSINLPEWLKEAFRKAYREVRGYRAKSWDDVFGRPHKKGTHLATKRQEREKSISVYSRIKKIKENEPTTPIDEALFERVAKEFHFCSKTMIAEYYYSWKNRLNK